MCDPSCPRQIDVVVEGVGEAVEEVAGFELVVGLVLGLGLLGQPTEVGGAAQPWCSQRRIVDPQGHPSSASPLVAPDQL